jgi:uncharacterized membrane protein
MSATLGRDARTVARLSKLVVLADWLFTAPTAILQPLTGFLLLQIAGLSMRAPWLAWSVALYVFAIACWLPVVWIQIRLAKEARACAMVGASLSQRYRRLMTAWTVLGALAFVAFLGIFWLMVTKTL